ncbi:hypothetical protein ACTFIW_012132 [Dictyostelium discoideum]
MQFQTFLLVELMANSSYYNTANRVITFYDSKFQTELTECSSGPSVHRLNLLTSKRSRIEPWATPSSLAVTDGILVSFFPPLTDMLKFSGFNQQTTLTLNSLPQLKRLNDRMLYDYVNNNVMPNDSEQLLQSTVKMVSSPISYNLAEAA